MAPSSCRPFRTSTLGRSNQGVDAVTVTAAAAHVPGPTPQHHSVLSTRRCCRPPSTRVVDRATNSSIPRGWRVRTSHYWRRYGHHGHGRREFVVVVVVVASAVPTPRRPSAQRQSIHPITNSPARRGDVIRPNPGSGGDCPFPRATQASPSPRGKVRDDRGRRRDNVPDNAGVKRPPIIDLLRIRLPPAAFRGCAGGGSLPCPFPVGTYSGQTGFPRLPRLPRSASGPSSSASSSLHRTSGLGPGLDGWGDHGPTTTGSRPTAWTCLEQIPPFDRRRVL